VWMGLVFLVGFVDLEDACSYVWNVYIPDECDM
jgi:hypothetical protein